MVSEVMNRMSSPGPDSSRQPPSMRPPARLPALNHPGQPEDGSGRPEESSSFQGIIPREIPFELPRLMDLNGSAVDDPSEPVKVRRRRPAPRVRLGQMTHRRHAGSHDGLDMTDADSIDERLRDVGVEGAPYPNQGLNSSRGSTPLCMVQVVGVGLSQSQSNLDLSKDGDGAEHPPQVAPSTDRKENDDYAQINSQLLRNPNALYKLMFSSSRLQSATKATRSAAVLKRLPLPRRHGEMWGNGAADFALTRAKGFIFHAERYQPPWSEQQQDDSEQPPAPQPQLSDSEQPPQARTESPDVSRSVNIRNITDEGWGSQERLQAEMEYMEGMRQLRRKREVVPHREPINLHMGGRKVMFFERMDIMGEIQRLKSVALPAKARELYVGRGFKLPPHHALNNPRPILHPVSADGKPSKSKSRKGAKYTGDYRSITGPTVTALSVEIRRVSELASEHHLSSGSCRGRRGQGQRRSAPIETAGGAADHDSLVMIGDSFSQSHRYYQGIESDIEGTLQDSRAKSRSKRHGPPAAKSGTPKSGMAPNPLKSGLIHQIDEEVVERLRQAFTTMSKNPQGNVEFNVLRPQLPEGLTANEETYAKQIYDIACQNSSFGFDQLVTLVCVCERIQVMTGDCKSAMEKIDFSTLEQSINGYIELFRFIDRTLSGCISMTSFRDMLSTSFGEELISKHGGFKHIEHVMGKEESLDISQADFLAFVPYFLTLEPK